MNVRKVLLVLAIVCSKYAESFTLQQLKDGQVYARDCIIKVGINPLAVGQLAKGDFTRSDEKIQVSLVDSLKLAIKASFDIFYHTS